MIYTYEISLNGSDYVSLYPTNHPKITTEKLSNEYIWRSKVDSFKINESLNSTIYGLLESWFTDSTKYSYTNNIRIKKSGVIKWTFEFGVKMGRLNVENKFYEIQPEPLDVYTDILYYKNRNASRALGVAYHYVNEDDAGLNEVDELYSSECAFFEDLVKTGAGSLIGTLNGLSSRVSDYTAQSAFLWNDNYPDETSPGGTDNYVSSDTNYLRFMGISRNNSSYINIVKSIEDILNLPKMFQCYWYCASDYTIHFEHVRWFEEQIADYQLDISGSDYYDDARIFEYSKPEILNAENFFFPTDNEADDFDDVQILYDPEMVNFSNEKIDIRSDYDTYLSSDFASTAKFLVAGNSALAVGYRLDPATAGGWVTFTTSGPDCTDGEADDAGDFAYTNLMVNDVGEDLSWSINVTYTPSLTNNLRVRGYLNNSAGSGTSWVTLAAGANSGTFSNSNNLRIEATGAQAFSYVLTVTASNTYRIPWEAGEISTNSLQNNYLSWANILNRWWKYSRYTETGTMNGSAETFSSVKFNKDQEIFKFYYASDIDPMRGIKTDYGTGMIQSITRDLETDWVTVKLRYNE